MQIINNVVKTTSSKRIYAPLALLLDNRLSIGARWFWLHLAALEPGTMTAVAFDEGVTGRDHTRRDYSWELQRCGWLDVSHVSPKYCDGTRYELLINASRVKPRPGEVCCARSIIEADGITRGARLAYFVLRAKGTPPVWSRGIMTKMEELLGISKMTARKLFYELASVGLLKRTGIKSNWSRWEMRPPSSFRLKPANK